MSHRSRTRRRCEQPESSRGSALQPRASGALQPHRDASPSARARRARAHPSPSLPRTTDSAAVTLLEQRELLTQACCAPRTAGVARGKAPRHLELRTRPQRATQSARHRVCTAHAMCQVSRVLSSFCPHSPEAPTGALASLHAPVTASHSTARLPRHASPAVRRPGEGIQGS